MKRIRLLVPVLGLAFALVPSTAVASAPYVESVAGIETGPPQSTTQCPYPNSVSSFAGIASGTLRGGFQIGVCHTPLTPGANILGGTFAISNGSTTVGGFFAPGGTVSFLSTSVVGSICIEKFAVIGGLLTGTLPAGSFTGRLTHYGFWTGLCNVFFATISGKANFTA